MRMDWWPRSDKVRAGVRVSGLLDKVVVGSKNFLVELEAGLSGVLLVLLVGRERQLPA